MEISKNEYEYARIVAAESKKPLAEALEIMAKGRDSYGVSFRDYNRIQLYKFTEKTLISNGERLRKSAEKEREYYSALYEATGRTEAQINADLAILNDNPYAQVSLAQYVELKMYDMSGSELKQTLIALRERTVLAQGLRKLLEEIDAGHRTYDDISHPLNEYYRVVEKTLTASEIEEVSEMIGKVCPALFEDEQGLRKTVTDMVVCKSLMGFWDFEYFMFGFPQKSLQQRRSFVSNNYRTTKLKQVNDRIKSDLFDNKALTYETFKEFFGREAVIIRSSDDFPVFKKFCQKHKSFVKKPLNGAMGSGIGKVKQDKNTDIRTLFDTLLNELGPFICEELIIAHPQIRKLNPDSVNTVRLSTYVDGKGVHMKWPFMKVGRAGSFVDNGGAGGILIAIDEKTGKFISNGIDEACHVFECHPDNGVVFKGYKLPDWEQALELGRKLAACALKRIPEVRYIGWDITYTDEGKWIIIEGNAFSQFIGQQAPLGVGVRDELDALIKG